MSDDTSFNFAEQMKAKRLGKNQELSPVAGEEGYEKTDEISSVEATNNEHESKNDEYVGGRATDLLKEERIRSTMPREYHPPTATDGLHSGSNDDWEEYSGKKSGLWGILKYPVVLPTLLCITGLLGFYLYTQTVSLIESLLAMPPILRIPLFGILILLAALVICGLYDYWKTYVALRKNLQVVWLDLDAMG